MTTASEASATLKYAASLIGPTLLSKVVFIGGATIPLFMTEQGETADRATKDVDCVVEATSVLGFHQQTQLLIGQGFEADTREGAPICRYVRDDLVLDILPSDSGILGYRQAWFKEVIDCAIIIDGHRVAAPAVLLATKLDAFTDRGQGDYLSSKDMEDVVALINGRPELVLLSRDIAPPLLGH